MNNAESEQDIETYTCYKQKGFVLDRSRGNHQIWLHPVTRQRAVVPMHRKDIPTGTFYFILKQTGIDKDDI